MSKLSNFIIKHIVNIPLIKKDFQEFKLEVMPNIRKSHVWLGILIFLLSFIMICQQLQMQELSDNLDFTNEYTDDVSNQVNDLRSQIDKLKNENYEILQRLSLY